MKEWLKFFGLGFFSDKTCKQAVKRSYLNTLLGFIIALVLLFAGVVAADVLPFKTHYKNADGFKEFLYNALADGAGAVKLSLKDGEMSADAVIDTYARAEGYALNGYDLVIDTRSADTYDDFTAYCEANDGTNQKITYEEYLTLSDAAKRNFEFKIEYSGRELSLTPALTEKHENYIEGLSADSDAVKGLKELKEKRTELGESEYARRCYELYVKAYYPSTKAYESTGGAPLLRNFYYHNYLNAKNCYLFIFSDTCVGSFKTNAGLKVQFYGFYEGLSDGEISRTHGGVDKFITQSFLKTAGVSMFVYTMNIIRLVPYLVLMPIVVAMLAFCFLRLMRTEQNVKFGGCVKIVGSFLMYSALIAALCTFICGYFAPRNLLYMLALLFFFSALLIRTGVLVIRERFKTKKVTVTEENSDDTLRG